MTSPREARQSETAGFSCSSRAIAWRAGFSDHLVIPDAAWINAWIMARPGLTSWASTGQDQHVEQMVKFTVGVPGQEEHRSPDRLFTSSCARIVSAVCR